MFDCALMVQHTVFVGPLFKHWNKFRFWASSSLRTSAIHLHMECRLIIIVCSPSTTSVCRLMTKQYHSIFFPKIHPLGMHLGNESGKFSRRVKSCLEYTYLQPNLNNKIPASSVVAAKSRTSTVCMHQFWLALWGQRVGQLQFFVFRELIFLGE